MLLCQGRIRLPAAAASEGPAPLQLAVNCSNPATATAAARCLPATTAAAEQQMPGLLEPGVACKLLLTAAMRENVAAVGHMVRLESMQQCIDAAALEAMLPELHKQDRCLDALCQLPAAAALSTDAAVRLLLAAIQDSYADSVHVPGTVLGTRTVWEVCSVAAAPQFSQEQVVTLLQACMEARAGTHSSSTAASMLKPSASFVFRRVINRPAAAAWAMQLSTRALVQLLHTVISVGDTAMFINAHTSALCSFPAAAAMSSADVASLLRAAFQRKGLTVYNTIRTLMHLPACRLLSRAEFEALMNTASEH
jgi:hypothetical protein